LQQLINLNIVNNVLMFTVRISASKNHPQA